MDILRTPDSAFAGLKDYPFAPNYVQIADDTLRLHYVDEGPKDAPSVLCMHGEPTWSYLYRHMIPIFAKAGHRVIAPDLIGFGKSDKPAARSDYTYQAHVDWMTEWLTALDLRNITLVCQDWGGLIGLRLVAAMPERFDRVVTANTALPTGDQPMGEAFESWRAFSQEVPIFPAGKIVYGGTTKKIDADEIAAYDAPYPDESFKAGARQFPTLVPSRPEDPASQPNRDAWSVLKTFEKPWLTAFGADDRVMAGIDKVFQKYIPGAAGQPHTTLPDAGHFLQEDVGEDLATLVNSFIENTG